MKRIGPVLAVVAGFAATSAAAQTLSIATTPTGTLNNRIGVALATVIDKEVKKQTRVTAYSGTEQFVPLVNDGEINFAIPSATDALFAYQGKEVYSRRKNPNLRSIGSLVPLFLSLLVTEKSGIRQVSDLRGKAVAAGYTNHAQARRYFLGVLASHGMSPKDVKQVAVPHVIAGVRTLMQGKTVASMFAVGVPKLAEINAKLGPTRFLSVNDSPEGLQRLREFVPTADAFLMKPQAKRLGILEPTKMLAERYLMVTSKSLPDDIAYKVAKMLYEKKKELTKIVGVFRLYQPKKLARDNGVPFHPGAEKFYREVGAWPGK